MFFVLFILFIKSVLLAVSLVVSLAVLVAVSLVVLLAVSNLAQLTLLTW